MLSLFANKAALAIENAKQKEVLAMTKAVAGLGIVVSSLAHTNTQKAAAIRHTVFALREKFENDNTAIEYLDHIDECAQKMKILPDVLRFPFDHESKRFELISFLMIRRPP